MSKRTTVVIPDGVDSMIDSTVRASGSTPEVPYLSQSDLIRLMLVDSCRRLVEDEESFYVGSEELDVEIEEESLVEIVPDSARAKFMRQRLIEDEQWLADMRANFRANVRTYLKTRFKNAARPGDIEDLADGYAMEAQIYWGIIGDDDERLQEELDWISDRVEQYRRDYEMSDYDPDEGLFSAFSGVESAIEDAEIAEVSEEIRAIAEDRYRERNPGRDELVESIALVYDLDRESVGEIVDEVRREDMIAQQQRADEGAPGSAPALTDDGVAHDAHARAPDYNREEVEDETIVEVSEEEAAELYGDDAIADGGEDVEVDRGDGPRTDGGVSKSPGQEGYWSELAMRDETDGERTETVLDRLLEELDPERLHGVTITRRQGETYYAVVSQTRRHGSGPVIDIRTVVIDLDKDRVRITDNGMWIPRDAAIADKLVSLVARTTTDIGSPRDYDPLTDSAVDVDADELLARSIGDDPDEEDDEPERASGWGDSWGNGDGPPPEIWEFVDRLEEAGVPTDRFSRLKFGDKRPFERYGNRAPNEELYGNYGVEIGLWGANDGSHDERMLEDDALLVIDVDDPESAPIAEIPSTYTVSSPHGSDDRAHYYLRCEDKAAVHDAFESLAIQPGWGEIWIAGEYVVGPGSYLDGCNKSECSICEQPDRGRYRVVDDRPIETISSDDLIELLESSWIGRETESDDDRDDSDDSDDSDDIVLEDDEEDEEMLVECHDCGAEIPDSSARLADRDGAPVYVCGGGCDAN